jgi:DHA1 family tetracycline resistance protein-like MFS transporter
MVIDWRRYLGLEPRRHLGPSAPPAKHQAAMRFVMVTMLIDMIGIGLIISVLPMFVGQFTGSLAEQAFWFSAID